MSHKTTSKHTKYVSCFVEFIPKNTMARMDLKIDTQLENNDHFKKIYSVPLLICHYESDILSLQHALSVLTLITCKQ